MSCAIAKGMSELPYRYSKMNRTENKFTSSNPVLNDEFQIEFQIGKEVTQKTAKINIIENQKGDVPTTCANIEYSNKILGYEPIISLKDGLQKMYDYYVKYNSEKTI